VGSVWIYSGRDGSLLWVQEPGVPFAKRFGLPVDGAGDVDGDGLADLIVGDEQSSPSGTIQIGAAYVFGLDPFLEVDARELSVGRGDVVRAALDFPASEAGQPYVLLVSAAGRGPVTVGGVGIPLTPDRYVRDMLGGWVPPFLQGAFGVLDAAGDATAVYVPAPALVRPMGTTFTTAAVSYDAAKGLPRASSVARQVTITP